jgi:hypothetical protein
MYFYILKITSQICICLKYINWPALLTADERKGLLITAN